MGSSKGLPFYDLFAPVGDVDMPFLMKKVEICGR